MDRLVISVPQMAQLLGISRGLAYELVNRGRAPESSTRLPHRRPRRAAVDGLLDEFTRAV